MAQDLYKTEVSRNVAKSIEMMGKVGKGGILGLGRTEMGVSLAV